MEQKPASVWEIIVPSVAFVVILGSLLVILGYQSPHPASQATPTAPIPPAQPTPTSPATARPLAPSPVVVANATPRLMPVIPEIAPDFTLERASGGTFALSEQLAQGPVVLAFFQKGG